MNEPRYAYIGVAPCGCVWAAVLDSPKHAGDVASEVMDFLQRGHVERVDIDTVRFRFCVADHPKDVCPHPGACPSRAHLKEA